MKVGSFVPESEGIGVLSAGNLAVIIVHAGIYVNFQVKTTNIREIS